ncbi:MAG: hypothetical protein AAGG38_04235 [Planctomycetota bacterium]
MPDERYPRDAELLALSRDAATGVEYIPTGKSPYYLEYRRSLHRMLRASERANDLRVYVDGDLSVGFRPGRCLIGGASVVFAGASGIAVETGQTTWYWLAADGEVGASMQGLPEDRATFVPLAEVVSGPEEIESVTDLRGEAFLQAPSVAVLGLTASAQEINQALGGIEASVTGAALNKVTGGVFEAADAFHTHASLNANTDGRAEFRVVNQSYHPDAEVSVRLSVPELTAVDTVVSLHPEHRYLQQSRGGSTYNLVGAVHLSWVKSGQVSASVADAAVGVVPIDGRVTAVVLSMAGNMESTEAGDGVRVSARVNGAPLTAAPGELTSADGPGFVCTDQGAGTPTALVAGDGAAVRRGDLVTVDLDRQVAGTVTNEARDVAVLVVVRADCPE